MTPQSILKIEDVEQRRRNDLRRDYNNHVLQGGYKANFREQLSRVKSLKKLEKMMKKVKEQMKALKAEEKKSEQKIEGVEGGREKNERVQEKDSATKGKV